jgi:hypothetical protein
MIEMADSPLAVWESFYVIVGSSAGALIGLQFVVITLVAGMRQRTGVDTVNAFGTPTVVHLAMALVVSATMSAPWPSLSGPSVLLFLCGLGGLIYEAIVIRRARRQTLYQPVREDWFWYMILPSVIYAAIAVAALFLRAASRGDAFIPGAAALALLLVGIRNAWDTVIHMVVTGAGDDAPKAG